MQPTPKDILQIKFSANSIIGSIYLLGELYSNVNFVTTDRFALSMLNKETEIENVAEGITKLAQNFEKEYQSYMQILSSALDKIGQ